jgi:hypothetical protein
MSFMAKMKVEEDKKKVKKSRQKKKKDELRNFAFGR